jgi:hypothetical protein
MLKINVGNCMTGGGSRKITGTNPKMKIDLFHYFLGPFLPELSIGATSDHVVAVSSGVAGFAGNNLSPIPRVRK